MEEYKQMYMTLFSGVAKATATLQEALKDAERIFLTADERSGPAAEQKNSAK
ncbi:MAG: hypothetical protein FWH16_05280 [Oscillospiraceae bacterium]|nr:hypothetical protein [Oscillospiraceae bacterium]